MRLITYAHPLGARPGAVIASVGGDRVLELSPELCHGASTVVEIVADASALAAAKAAVAAATEETAALPLLADVKLLPPVRPGKIICLGYNYRGHVRAGEDPTAGDPEYPDVFVKTPNVLASATDPVVLAAATRDVDYEGEIALVIGTRAREVPLESAMDYVAGYALFNDVSDRHWQGRTSQWELGKCFDGFGPLGPTLVTADEIADPHDLLVEVLREGVVTVSQSTSTMIFPMAYVVHYLSTVMTLEPGDVISTGSPQKLPEALAAYRRLEHGDSVTVRVAGLGELTTTFIDPPAADSPASDSPEENHDS
ncbi:2-keto-4-pentenoate hydratase/2-oxohepta-3-ene-1,7-dioic acid hydratase in catechol pathway [Glaciihabitans tibetensis]|uniref:2-keto-4-pentenoate hydratase/2-oxohepta-3-ene-1,7-dioic acid hydratase in catechol pathway n=1 Tax=Glaciihabitans tibetensis TaxID=1266600 RepID=A0A2T0VE31_9MICO|nr:fumarylacetoacetate hydrolase family protein [Glaciihabitans tibetensis]PRY68411.1 2-keto-4-pentenoate hydratase/2-oxohepta-3-ene-1,7-dioic acid hydratase in catechol pathway [Glaciihabitans tibetensis]